MDEVRHALGRASFRRYISTTFGKKTPKVPLDATGAEASSSRKHAEEASNTLNVASLHKLPFQFAANQHWYYDDLSRVSETTIRLLYLEPGQFNDPIVARLICHPVEFKPRYDALSYSWGEQNDWNLITLNGKYGFAVTQTVWCALRRLRSTAVARPMWIDAICINQSNTAERNQQVCIMDSTFGNARSVLIWLGDCGEGEFADRNTPLVDHILSDLECDVHDATRAWWNRLWVVQEVALAKELMVYFGPHVITWADFFMSAEARPNFRGVVNLRTARAFVQSHGFAEDEEVSLEELLALTGNCYASDPLDYVFGLIGLVPRQQSLQEHRLSPDYTVTPYELLTRLNGYLESVGDHFDGPTMLNKMLSWTASIGHLQLAKLLLDSKQIYLATEGPMALFNAAVEGQVSMLKMLLDDFHLNASSRDHVGRTPLFLAAARAQTETVRLLINEYNVDPSARDNLGRTPLSWAATNTVRETIGVGRILDTMRVFLDISDVDPDAEDAMGRPPLAWAVRAGCKPVVELLLETGRMDLSRRFGGHPLVALAFTFQHYSIAELLIEKGVPDWKIKSQRKREKFVASGQAGFFDPDFWSGVLLHIEGGEGSGRPPAYDSL